MKITPETQDYLPFRIAGILILNNGDHPYILQTVRSIEHQLDDLIVIDNATTDQTFKAFTRLRTVLDTETVFFDDQQPITECINIAMHRLPEATDWVTWFTPNSIFHPEFVATLQEKITKASKKEKTQPGLIIAGATTFQEEDPQNLQSYWPPRTDRQTTWDQSFLASYQTLVEAGPHRPEASRLCEHYPHIKEALKKRKLQTILHEESLVAVRIRSEKRPTTVAEVLQMAKDKISER